MFGVEINFRWGNMGLLDFLFRRKHFEPLSSKRRRKPVEQAQEIERAIKQIRKSPLLKYTYDKELLEAIRLGQEQMIDNQQLIIDYVTVKDK